MPLPAIIAVVLVAAAIAAVVIVRLGKGRRSEPETPDDAESVSWRLNAMAGAPAPVPEKPAKAPKAPKAPKATKAPLPAPAPVSNPVAALAAQIAAASPQTAAAPKPAPVSAKSSARNRAAAARSRAAAARNKVETKPAPPVVVPLAFDPFDDYLSAPPTPAIEPKGDGDTVGGKTLADMRLGDYRIGAPKTSNGEPDQHSDEKV